MNKNTKEMTYREIFAEIYSENKREILAYITFALVVSIFMFGGSSRTMASSEASFMSLGGGFTGSLNLLLCYMFPTIEPCIGMGISAILAIP